MPAAPARSTYDPARAVKVDKYLVDSAQYKDRYQLWDTSSAVTLQAAPLPSTSSSESNDAAPAAGSGVSAGGAHASRTTRDMQLYLAEGPACPIMRIAPEKCDVAEGMSKKLTGSAAKAKKGQDAAPAPDSAALSEKAEKLAQIRQARRTHLLAAHSQLWTPVDLLAEPYPCTTSAVGPPLTARPGAPALVGQSSVAMDNGPGLDISASADSLSYPQRYVQHLCASVHIQTGGSDGRGYASHSVLSCGATSGVLEGDFAVRIYTPEVHKKLRPHTEVSMVASGTGQSSSGPRPLGKHAESGLPHLPALEPPLEASAEGERKPANCPYHVSLSLPCAVKFVGEEPQRISEAEIYEKWLYAGLPIMQFKPHVLHIALGLDSVVEDRIGFANVTAAGIGCIVALLCAYGGLTKVVAVSEGGYGQEVQKGNDKDSQKVMPVSKEPVGEDSAAKKPASKKGKAKKAAEKKNEPEANLVSYDNLKDAASEAYKALAEHSRTITAVAEYVKKRDLKALARASSRSSSASAPAQHPPPLLDLQQRIEATHGLLYQLARQQGIRDTTAASSASASSSSASSSAGLARPMGPPLAVQQDETYDDSDDSADDIPHDGRGGGAGPVAPEVQAQQVGLMLPPPPPSNADESLDAGPSAGAGPGGVGSAAVGMKRGRGGAVHSNTGDSGLDGSSGPAAGQDVTGLISEARAVTSACEEVGNRLIDGLHQTQSSLALADKAKAAATLQLRIQQLTDVSQQAEARLRVLESLQSAYAARQAAGSRAEQVEEARVRHQECQAEQQSLKEEHATAQRELDKYNARTAEVQERVTGLAASLQQLLTGLVRRDTQEADIRKEVAALAGLLQVGMPPECNTFTAFAALLPALSAKAAASAASLECAAADVQKSHVAGSALYNNIVEKQAEATKLQRTVALLGLYVQGRAELAELSASGDSVGLRAAAIRAQANLQAANEAATAASEKLSLAQADASGLQAADEAIQALEQELARTPLLPLPDFATPCAGAAAGGPSKKARMEPAGNDSVEEEQEGEDDEGL